MVINNFLVNYGWMITYGYYFKKYLSGLCHKHKFYLLKIGMSEGSSWHLE